MPIALARCATFFLVNRVRDTLTTKVIILRRLHCTGEGRLVKEDLSCIKLLWALGRSISLEYVTSPFATCSRGW